MRFPRFTAFLALFFAFSMQVTASDFEDGVRAAKAKNWSAAEHSFRKSIASHPMSANAHYNLGTSLAAQQKDSEAIWALEKSLKLNPSLKQAASNIQFCYGKLGITEAWQSPLPHFQQKAYRFGIDNWTYISIALALVSSVLVFVFLVSTKSGTRKITLIFAAFTFLILFFALKYALGLNHFRYNDTHAIVIRDESSVYYDAIGNRKRDLNLKGGTRHEIKSVSNGRIGLLMKNQMVVWIDARAVRTI